jgi:NADH:quinone reductase (non-electrogenic)
VGPELTVRDHPEMYAVGDIAAITDAKTKTVLPQLGSVALQSGERAGETIARPIAGEATKPFTYRDKMATIGRGAAVLQTNEDRAEAVVDWAGAGMTHQRAGRITVETDEERDLAGAGKRAPTARR